jgi:hypothetical protein
LLLEAAAELAVLLCREREQGVAEVAEGIKTLLQAKHLAVVHQQKQKSQE